MGMVGMARQDQPVLLAKTFANMFFHLSICFNMFQCVSMCFNAQKISNTGGSLQKSDKIFNFDPLDPEIP